MKLVIETKKDPTFTFYVLKRNGNLYAVAQTLRKGEVISVFLRRYLGKYFCTKLMKKE